MQDVRRKSENNCKYNHFWSLRTNKKKLKIKPSATADYELPPKKQTVIASGVKRSAAISPAFNLAVKPVLNIW